MIAEPTRSQRSAIRAYVDASNIDAVRASLDFAKGALEVYEKRLSSVSPPKPLKKFHGHFEKAIRAMILGHGRLRNAGTGSARSYYSLAADQFDRASTALSQVYYADRAFVDALGLNATACSQFLPQDATLASAAGERDEGKSSGSKYCGQCGSVVLGAQNFCTECGAKVAR